MRVSLVKAQKAYLCCWCWDRIEPGEMHISATVFEDGPPERVRACRFCQESCSRYVSREPHLEIEPGFIVFEGWLNDFWDRHDVWSLEVQP